MAVELKKIEFKDYQEPSISAENLNKVQENMQKALDEKQDTLTSGGVPIGSGCDYFGTVAPENYMFADGSAISKTEYPELYAVIGDNYRNEENTDETTFNLPDKRERVSVMYKEGSTNFGSLGGKVGSDTHQLTEEELPKVEGQLGLHNVLLVSHEGYNLFSNNTGVFSLGDEYTEQQRVAEFTASNQTYIRRAKFSMGGDLEHNNIQQSFVCNYIIKVK